MVRGGSSPLGRTWKPRKSGVSGVTPKGTSRETPSPCGKTWQESARRLAARARRPTWLDANTRRVPLSGGRRPHVVSRLLRRLKRGPASEARPHEPKRRGQIPIAHAGPRRTRRAANHPRDLREHFDGLLKGQHPASNATRDGYRAAGERRLKP